MADIGWRRRRGSSPAARTGARQRAGLTPASASNTLSCQRETLHSQQLKSIKKSIDSDHGIYRDLRNVAANYPLERPHKFAGIQPNSVDRDYSRLSCAKRPYQISPRPGWTGKLRAGDADGLNFFRSIVTFPRGWRPEFALRRPLEFPTVPSEGDFHVGREFLLLAFLREV